MQLFDNPIATISTTHVKSLQSTLFSNSLCEGEDLKSKLAEIYPCNEPQNPHMQSQFRREETFDARWNRRKVIATVQEISAAGFFFLGNLDFSQFGGAPLIPCHFLNYRGHG